MKKLVMFLFTILFSVTFTCSRLIRTEKYVIKNGKAYFNSYENERLASEKELKNIDIKSFKILNENDVAYDKNNIYLFGITQNKADYKTAIYNADKETLKVLYSRIVSYEPYISYYKDKNHVYYNYIEVDGADTESFKVLDGSYTKDKNSVYYMGNKMENTDSESFSNLENGYYKDKKFIYYNGKALEKSDSSKGFKIAIIEKIGGPCGYNFDMYISNNDNVYAFGDLVTGKAKYDPITFTAYQNEYSKDKNGVYSLGEKIANLDTATFKFYNYAYVSDKNGVYYNKEKISGADPKSFVLLKRDNLPDDRYGKDKDSVYYNGKKIEGSDVNSFKIIDFSYAKDKDKVYFDGNVITDADPATFGKAFSKTKGYTGYFMDKKNVYSNGYILKEESVKNFKYRK